MFILKFYDRFDNLQVVKDVDGILKRAKYYANQYLFEQWGCDDDFWKCEICDNDNCILTISKD